MATQRRRIGLRTRVISSFGLLSLLLSLGLAGATYFLVQANTIERREATALDEAFANARQIRNQILDDSDGVEPVSRDDLLRRAPIDGIAVLSYTGDVLYSGRTVGNAPFDPTTQLPVEFGHAVDERRATMYRSAIDDEPVLFIGVPIQLGDDLAGPPADGSVPDAASTTTAPVPPQPARPDWAAYYEISSLADLQSTFDTMLLALLGAVVLTTLVGLLVGRWVSKRVLAPLRDVNDAVEALAEMSFDTKLPVTRDPDLAPLVSTFNHTVAALHERIERDGRFASDVSHELRSPLTTLTNSVAILERYQDDLPEPAQRAVALLTEEFQRFQQLVGDLLEISRFDAGAQKLERSPLVIGEFVRLAVRMTCPDQDIPVNIDPDLEEAVIMADKRRLVQVLSNLAVNAQRYAGGVTEVGVTRARGGVEIAVVDSGPGVPLADRIRVFDRFARASPPTSAAATPAPAWLSLVAEHMRVARGGTVRVEDHHGGVKCLASWCTCRHPGLIYDTEADFEAAASELTCRAGGCAAAGADRRWPPCHRGVRSAPGRQAPADPGPRCPSTSPDPPSRTPRRCRRARNSTRSSCTSSRTSAASSGCRGRPAPSPAGSTSRRSCRT
ncbi:MAG: histidine kinase dimerization/phospho-acceptor domain-containing protein [Acidimicrobiales bacterium]